MLHRLRQFLLTPTSAPGSQTRFWFSLSLTFAAIYSVLALRQAFGGEYVVQDDARQHVFWMQRFLDPALFPNDLIADYFQAVAPVGYKTLYQAMALVGLEPGVFNKLLPLVLGVVTAGYCFGLALEILPIPIAGFIASLVYNQNLWLRDDLASATPRAFVYPLFLAFLYYLLRRSLLPCLITLILQALFYPAYVFVSVGLLLLRLCWQDGKLGLPHNRQDYQFGIAGLAVGAIGLLPFMLASSGYGPTISAAAARQLPEFWPGGRSGFFTNDPLTYWLTGYRSSLLPQSLFTPITVIPGLVLPLLLRLPDRFPRVKQVSRHVYLLPQLLLVCTGLFLLAHAVLFKLHLPNRYTGVSFCLVIALASGVALTLILDAVYGWATQRSFSIGSRPSLSVLGFTLLLGVVLILYPSFVNKFPITSYKIGTVPELYQFLAQQPKDSLTASLSGEASNLPTFTQRSILIGPEYAIPYQVGYYRQFRQRALDLVRAQYSPDPTVVRSFIQQYGVDFWLLDAAAFEPAYVASNQWIQQYQPAGTEALEILQRGDVPVLKRLQNCTVHQSPGLILLEATCISKGL